jgi:hypothetical protein
MNFRRVQSDIIDPFILTLFLSFTVHIGQQTPLSLISNRITGLSSKFQHFRWSDWDENRRYIKGLHVFELTPIRHSASSHSAKTLL